MGVASFVIATILVCQSDQVHVPLVLLTGGQKASQFVIDREAELRQISQDGSLGSLHEKLEKSNFVILPVRGSGTMSFDLAFHEDIFGVRALKGMASLIKALDGVGMAEGSSRFLLDTGQMTLGQRQALGSLLSVRPGAPEALATQSGTVSFELEYDVVMEYQGERYTVGCVESGRNSFTPFQVGDIISGANPAGISPDFSFPEIMSSSMEKLSVEVYSVDIISTLSRVQVGALAVDELSRYMERAIQEYQAAHSTLIDIFLKWSDDSRELEQLQNGKSFDSLTDRQKQLLKEHAFRQGLVPVTSEGKLDYTFLYDAKVVRSTKRYYVAASFVSPNEPRSSVTMQVSRVRRS